MADMTPKQIRAALEAKIITPAQAKEMLARVDKAELPATAQAAIGHEDEMRFLRSFSDVFISIGLVILVFGLSGILKLMGGGPLYLFGAGLIGIMAHYFGRVKRAHLPTLVLALTFLIFTQIGFGAIFPNSGIISALITAGAMALFYWHIRLPFCVALIALALLYLLFAILDQLAPGLTRSNLGLVLLAAGIAVFTAALAYDTRDTHRRTRFADNAFWLHFIAAPMIIHGLAIMTVSLKADTLFGFVPMVSLSRGDAGFLLIIIGIITIIGLAINRRALIVSSLGYAGFALAYLLDGTGMGLSMTITSALLILGGAIVFLGVGWHATRNQLIKVLPKWKVFPPPYEEQTAP